MVEPNQQIWGEIGCYQQLSGEKTDPQGNSVKEKLYLACQLHTSSYAKDASA